MRLKLRKRALAGPASSPAPSRRWARRISATSRQRASWSASSSICAALSYPTGDPNLLGSYSCWLVGQYTKFAGYEGKRQGNVYFAGEHTSLAYQGYMEGGAETGDAAARALLKAQGVVV